jgi:glycerophosphoryl diester phosphodiesterase
LHTFIIPLKNEAFVCFPYHGRCFRHARFGWRSPLLVDRSNARNTLEEHARYVHESTFEPREAERCIAVSPDLVFLYKETCAEEIDLMHVSNFAIGHRGACLQFPEHTLESYKAGAIQGAGIIECDVTFTKDRELVCRHAQCDLHTTTNVVTIPELNAKCTKPWVPMQGEDPICCTSDFTLEEIKMLCAKMDSKFLVNATQPEEYAFGGTPDWRTDLYSTESCPEVPTHMEYISLVHEYGGYFTPELKSPDVEMPYEGDYTQEDYAQQMIDEYIAAGIPPEQVWPQSFNPSDVFYWIKETDYGAQAVVLDENDNFSDDETDAFLDHLVENGVRIVAPPMQRLVDAAPDTGNLMVASHYAMAAKERGLGVITWTLERAGPGLTGYYYNTTDGIVDLEEGDRFTLLDVLHKEVGILGIFSDWPATATFYANCMGIELRSRDGTSVTAVSRLDMPPENSEDGKPQMRSSRMDDGFRA